MLLLTGSISAPAAAVVVIPEKSISGRVTDENGEPMPGVNILVKSTSIGTISDVEGRYKLMVPDNTTTLVFSSVGYIAKEIDITGRSTIDLKMEQDVTALSEVVVIGYGSVRKSDLTGAVSSVSSEELERVPITSLDQGLSGRVPGVMVTQASAAPGGGISVRIRGGNSINSGNEPLYVIDGFPIYSDNGESSVYSGAYNGTSSPNALSTISPDDIESIEILKDASATAIYGSRGANGVVLITTKRGKEGAPQVNYNAYFGMQKVAKKLDLLNGQEYAELVNQANINEGEPVTFDGVVNPLPSELGEGTDWQDEVFRTAYQQNHQVSVSGGSSNTRYSASANYYDQKGIVIGSRFQRASVRMNMDTDITKKLKLGINLKYSRSVGHIAQSESSNTGATMGLIGSAIQDVPVFPVYKEDGSFFSQPDIPPDMNFRHQENPVALALTGKDINTSNRFLGNMYLDYTILDGLSLNFSFGTDLFESRRNVYFPRGTRVGDRDNGYAMQGLINKTSWLSENTITYKKDFNENHRLNMVAGVTWQEEVRLGNKVEATNFINDILQDNKLSAGAVPGIPNSFKSKWQIGSVLGRINYALYNKYLFTFSGRADGSSRFGAGNKWAFFPSVALAWRMIEEDFLQRGKVFSDLKWRASYGITGNTQINVYQSQATLGISNYAIGNQMVVGIGPASVANPDLKWETTTMYNAGLDVGMFENRLTLTADYYYNLTEDLLMEVVLPRSYGFKSSFRNSGELRNYGVEIGVNAHILTGKLKWESNVNWSMNRNEILKLGSEPFYARNIGGINGAYIAEGYPLGVWYGAVTNGIYQNLDQIAEDPWAKEKDLGTVRFVDVSGDGDFDELADRAIIGDPNPDFIWGWNNNFTFKNFELNVFINGVQGNEIISPQLRFTGNVRPRVSNQVREFVTNAWTAENPNTNTPKATSGNNGRLEYSDFFIYDGSFIRLKNVMLAYNVPKNKIFRSAKVFVSGQNLFLLSDYYGYDPETNSQGQNNLNLGVDMNSYPSARTYTVGINVGF